MLEQKRKNKNGYLNIVKNKEEIRKKLLALHVLQI
jgi:hypothetical protein